MWLKIKGDVHGEKTSSSSLFLSVALATVWSFSSHYGELISFCWRIDVRLWIIGSTLYI